jgi:hypothetical protein
VLLRVTPTNVVRLLRPPGAATWAAAVRRRSLAPDDLLRRLVETRMRLVRSDQYESFLANPDPAGANAATYVFRTLAVAMPHVGKAGGSGGSSPLLVVLVAAGSVALAAGAVVLWAHS